MSLISKTCHLRSPTASSLQQCLHIMSSFLNRAFHLEEPGIFKEMADSEVDKGKYKIVLDYSAVPIHIENIRVTGEYQSILATLKHFHRISYKQYSPQNT